IAAAELELNEWRRQGDCPAAARVLLAAITARRGELEAALAILGAARDPEAMKLRITLLVELNRLVEAHQAVEQLHHEHGRDPALDEWFAAVDAPGAETLPIVSDAAADHLASDLCESIDLLPTLVAAQKIRPD